MRNDAGAPAALPRRSPIAHGWRLSVRAGAGRLPCAGDARRSGTSARWCRRKSSSRRAEVSALDFFVHLIDVAGRERVPGSRPNGVESPVNVGRRTATPGRPKRLPDPLGDGHPMRARRFLDFAPLGIVDQDLESLSHVMSLFDSWI